MVKMCINRDEKENAVKVCDSAFPPGVSICDKKNYYEIIDKIDQFADFIVDYENGEVVGYAAMYNNDTASKTAYITMIGVREEYQRKHIGRKIMAQCKANAMRKNMKVIRLEVLDSNEKAIQFYENEGFVFEKRCSENSRYMV